MSNPATIDIPDSRLIPQRLAGLPFNGAGDVVGWLTAMQSQDFHGGKWSIGLRAPGLTEVAIEDAFNRGDLLRTHVLRPTWHFVLPEDIRWMQELTAPRVRQLNAFMYKREGLTPELLAQSNRMIVRALEGGEHLTRDELGDILAREGIEAARFRLSYLAMHAELEALICSGAMHGKQHTYALVDHRAPNARRLDRDEALAELTLRYFRSHGPATVKDFTRWSSLTTADAKRGIEMNTAALDSTAIGDRTYWHGSPLESSGLDTPWVRLVQGYDEYVIAYSDSNDVYAPAIAFGFPQAGTYNHAVILNGNVAGNWKRTLKKREIILEIRLIAPLTAEQLTALEDAATHYATFAGLPVSIAPR